MKRNTENFLSLIESNKGIIYKIANLYCKDNESRKDLIQEIIIQLWLSFEKYDDAYKISTWIYRIALNVSISFYRKEKRRSEINYNLPDDVLFFNQNEEEIELNDDLKRLNDFIKELKEIDRAIIILYLDEVPQQEIAERLGLSVTNISTKISRIKQQLRQRFSNIKG